MARPNAAGETRTLHPLALPARLSDPGAAELRRGLYVACETTGFSPEHDAVIELALLPFTYTLAGTVVEVLHDEAQAHRNDPGRPLPAEITHLTGLMDDDVRGERIDAEAASALIKRSGLMVAHNARFDRPFVERMLPAARARPEHPADLHGWPLLYDLAWDDYWAHWFASREAGAPDMSRASGYRLYSMMVQAAVEGMGVALGHSLLIAPCLERGTLVELLGPPVVAPARYFLAVAPGAGEKPEARAFLDWLRAESARKSVAAGKAAAASAAQGDG